MRGAFQYTRKYVNVVHKGLSMYPRVCERIHKGLSIYLDIHGRGSHSPECIANKRTTTAMFINVETCLLAQLSLHLECVLLVSNNGVGGFY